MVCVVLPTLPEMSQNLATGATRFFPNPATILHGGQLCPTGRLAIRSEAAGGRLLCSPPSVKINISRWGRTCCTRDTEARLASSAKGSALRVGYPEDLRLESFKLPRGISRSKQGGDGAHRETKVVGNLVKRVLAESTTSVAKLLAKSTIELFGRKLERVGGARNSEVAGAKVAANVVHKSGRSLEANEPDIGEAGIGAEAGDNSEVLDDLRKRVDKSKPELGRSTLNCGGENIMDRVAVMLETRAVDEVLSEPDNQVHVNTLRVSVASTVVDVAGRLNDEGQRNPGVLASKTDKCTTSRQRRQRKMQAETTQRLRRMDIQDLELGWMALQEKVPSTPSSLQERVVRPSRRSMTKRMCRYRPNLRRGEVNAAFAECP